jgi:hypothetical protein
VVDEVRAARALREASALSGEATTGGGGESDASQPPVDFTTRIAFMEDELERLRRDGKHATSGKHGRKRGGGSGQDGKGTSKMPAMDPESMQRMRKVCGFINTVNNVGSILFLRALQATARSPLRHWLVGWSLPFVVLPLCQVAMRLSKGGGKAKKGSSSSSSDKGDQSASALAAERAIKSTLAGAATLHMSWQDLMEAETHGRLATAALGHSLGMRGRLRK